LDQSRKPKRPLGLGGYVLTFGVTALVAALAGIGSATFGDQPGAVGLGLTIAMISVAMAVGFAACLWWWRGIDEAAREAHKWAWWWGGSGGMAVGGVVLLSLMARDDATPLPAGIGPDAGDVFVAGMLAVLLFQLAGYVIAWAGWWLKHR
jgi:hypothetical protein